LQLQPTKRAAATATARSPRAHRRFAKCASRGVVFAKGTVFAEHDAVVVAATQQCSLEIRMVAGPPCNQSSECRQAGFVARLFCFRTLRKRLLDGSGGEVDESVVAHRVSNFDWPAADFAIFHVALVRHGRVQNHRNLFAAVRAIEELFHVVS
jgi:hypothetical protein